MRAKLVTHENVVLRTFRENISALDVLYESRAYYLHQSKNTCGGNMNRLYDSFISPALEVNSLKIWHNFILHNQIISMASNAVRWIN